LFDSKEILTSEAMSIDNDVAPEGGSTNSTWNFRLTVLRHYRPVYRMAAALLGDSAEAEDVTQEAFTRYWQQKQRIEKPQHWLMRVAHNACLDRLRKTGRFVSDEDRPEAPSREVDDPARCYEQTEIADRLRRHIDTLPELQRSLVVLFDIRGFSGAMCAKILDINENQVKVYLHRARRKLRLKLEQDDE